ncbi:MAG: EAL domain-containing protein [Halioglobus sp.]
MWRCLATRLSPLLEQCVERRQRALRNDRENMALLQRASEVGFSIVLDDFGTGYSSISLLDQLPLSKVKLDHSFVHSAMQSEQGKTLLAAILSLLKEMNLCCCVEGVSDPVIEQYVASLGCEEVQGFLIGKPQIIGPDFRWPT